VHRHYESPEGLERMDCSSDDSIAENWKAIVPTAKITQRGNRRVSSERGSREDYGTLEFPHRRAAESSASDWPVRWTKVVSVAAFLSPSRDAGRRSSGLCELPLACCFVRYDSTNISLSLPRSRDQSTILPHILLQYNPLYITTT
jgi:hypothetical protein